MIACAGALVAAAPSAGLAASKAKPPKPADAHASKAPFGDIPKGPLQIIISIDQQKLHLYSDGVAVTDTAIATGVPEHPTPLGIFSVIQKSRYHRSNIYSDAPMPYMQRITWSGVALHEGTNLGHPASHGCIRMSQDFATRLWALTRAGARVIIARPELKPEPFADARLFVRADKPVKTAQSADEGKATDAATERAGQNAAQAAADNATNPPAAKDPEAANTVDRPLAEPAAPSEPATASANPADQPTVTTIELARTPSKAPIAIFISRKTKTIYVRQDFEPLLKAPAVIEDPERPLGSHVFTALDTMDDHVTFRWNVVSLPGERSKPETPADTEKRTAKGKSAGKRADGTAPVAALPPPPPQTPQQALARITIPQDAIDQIAQVMKPGSSLIISDQGLGEETGEGTDFIVVARDEYASAAARDRAQSAHHHRMRIYYWW